MNEDKIQELFHYFNIQNEVDSVYGNWAVSKKGDVVNFLYPYAILSIHLTDNNWIEKMQKKVWFKPECEDELKQALARAQELTIK